MIDCVTSLGVCRNKLTKKNTYVTPSLVQLVLNGFMERLGEVNCAARAIMKARAIAGHKIQHANHLSVVNCLNLFNLFISLAPGKSILSRIPGDIGMADIFLSLLLLPLLF